MHIARKLMVLVFGLFSIAATTACAQPARRTDAQKKPDYRTEFAYVTMSDGVKIALAVAYPRGFATDLATAPSSSAAVRTWPAVLEMHGYPDSTIPQSPEVFGHQYVTVRASLRGAGASDGVIQPISQRNGQDGYEVIENWIVKQPWSNGKVAIHGHSWGGLSALMVAATNPPHLKAVAVSGLMDDIYRDIGRIGGVRNAGFPMEWMVNLYNPLGPFDSGEAARQARGLSTEEYQQIVASRPPLDFSQSVLWAALTSQQDLPAFTAASLGSHAGGVRAPIHIMHSYQDEQTGPSGVWLWTYVPDDVPKRLVLTNGDHGEVMRFLRERLDWLNYWTLGDGAGAGHEFSDRAQRVQVYFETPRDSQRPLNAPLVAAEFPLPQTRWTRGYFQAGQRLATEPPAPQDAGNDTYSVAVGRPDSDLQGVYYLYEFAQSTAICGPIAVKFWATCSTVDTDFYVVVADVDANGTAQLLQRGLLRASHRALDMTRSKSVSVDGQHILVRPRHTHRGPSPLKPGEPYQFDVEVGPVGHVFRPGHSVAIWISPPPLNDPVTRHDDGRPAYVYDSAMPPSTVQILRSDKYPSHVVLPLLPELPPLSQPLPAGKQAGIYVR